MKTIKEVYKKVLKETDDVCENVPYALVKLYMIEYGKLVVDECAKIQHETPIGYQYEKIMKLKDKLK